MIIVHAILNALTDVLGKLIVHSERHERELVARREPLESKKKDLIAQMGSSVKDVAVAAAEELSRQGWLTDGSLQGANLARANLQGARLTGADLRRAFLFRADLRGVELTGAELTGARFDDDTQWPDGFDPVEAGAQKVD